MTIMFTDLQSNQLHYSIFGSFNTIARKWKLLLVLCFKDSSWIYLVHLARMIALVFARGYWPGYYSMIELAVTIIPK